MALSSSLVSAHFCVKKASAARDSSCPVASQASITFAWAGGSGSAAMAASSVSCSAIPSVNAGR